MDDFMVWFAPVIVALITGGFSYLGVSKTVRASHNKMLMDLKAEQDKFALSTSNQIQTVMKDIRRLEDKQDKHNAVIERTFKLEQKVEDLEKRIS